MRFELPITVNQVMLYGICKTTKRRLGFLWGTRLAKFFSPIEENICRHRGHHDIIEVKGDFVGLICRRCGESTIKWSGK